MVTDDADGCYQQAESNLLRLIRKQIQQKKEQKLYGLDSNQPAPQKKCNKIEKSKKKSKNLS